MHAEAYYVVPRNPQGQGVRGSREAGVAETLVQRSWGFIQDLLCRIERSLGVFGVGLAFSLIYVSDSSGSIAAYADY